MNKTFCIDDIIQEILSGEYVKDTLPNSAVSFSGEHEAIYFSNQRRFMQSDLADLVINSGQCLDDLEWLKKVGILNHGK